MVLKPQPQFTHGSSLQSPRLPGTLRTDFDGLKHLNVLGYADAESIPWLEKLKEATTTRETDAKGDLSLVAKHRWFRAYVEEVLQGARMKVANGADVYGALTRLRVAATRLPNVGRPSLSLGASTHAVDAFEAAMDARLPTDLRTLLQVCETVEAKDVGNGYSIGGIDQLTRLSKDGDYPRTGYGSSDSKAIPIATVFFCTLLVSTADGSVWRWNPATEPPEPEKVSDTIPAFLDRVAQDWGHLAEGNDSWQYLCGSPP